MAPTCGSQPTTVPMTPMGGSHIQLQYQWHQPMAVTNNYNTDDINMWQSQTTSILMTPTSGSHRQHKNEQLCDQWLTYVQYLQTGATIAQNAQSPLTNIKATTVHIKEWRVLPMKVQKSQQNKKRLCCLIFPLLTPNMNTNYLKLLSLQAQTTFMTGHYSTKVPQCTPSHLPRVKMLVSLQCLLATAVLDAKNSGNIKL